MASQHAEGGEEVVLVVDDADGGPAKSSGGGGLVGAYFTLLTGAIGVGILSFPYAFRSAGLAGNLFLGLAFAVLNAYTLWVLASLAHRYGPHLRQFATYEALVHHVLGRPAYVVMVVCILFNTVGALSAYLIVVGDLGHVVLDHFLHSHPNVPDFLYSRAFLVILFCMLVALPLSLFPNIHHLSFSSFLAVASVLVVAGMVMSRGIESCVDGKNENGHYVKDELKVLNLDLEFFLAVPLVVFSLGCHLTVVPVYRELQEEKKTQLGRVLLLSVATCIFVYLAAGVMGYARFGESTEGDILANFPVEDVMVDVGKLLMAAHIALAYPVGLYPATKALLLILSFLPIDFFQPEESHWGRWRASILHWGVTFLMLGFTAGLAILVPNVQIVFGLVGSTTAVAINFGGPAAMLFVSPLSLPLTEDGQGPEDAQATSALVKKVDAPAQINTDSPQAPLLPSEMVNASLSDYHGKDTEALLTPRETPRRGLFCWWPGLLDRVIAVAILLLSVFITVCGTSVNIYQNFF